MICDGRASASRLLLAIAGAALVLLASAPAHADWPQPRADATRTGAASGKSNLTAPVPYWRYYLGGAIAARGALFLDVDSDTTGEVVFVSGGKLLAKERTNELVWETPVLGISTILGLADLDGNDTDELVVHGRNQVFVVEVATGRIVWEEPADDFGSLGGARLGDLDGDGTTDLFVQECGCCRINNGNTGFIYRFARGYAAAERLWTLPSVRCGGNRSMAIGDFDGNGRAEVTLGENRRIRVLDGATGAELAATDDLGERTGESQCLPIDIDQLESNGQELVCVQSNSPLATPAVGHRVFVLRYARGSGSVGRLEVVWQKDVGALNSSVVTGPQPVTDLDGDGDLEIVASGMDATGTTWTTYVFDAATGSGVAELAGERIAGVVPAGAVATSALLLTSRDDGLTAWRFVDGMPAMQWSLPGQRALIELDWAASARSSVGDRILLLDVTSDGTPELITTSVQGSQDILAHDLSAGMPTMAARVTLDATNAVLAAWATPAMAGEASLLLLATSDGIMRLFDAAELRGMPPEQPAPLRRGVRFGGYFPRGDWRNLHITPVTGNLGAGLDSVIITDSRGALVRLDAGDASLAAPPLALWEVPNTTGPMLVPAQDDAAASSGIACWQENQNGDHRVTMLDPEGRVAWRGELPGGVLLSDIVPAWLDGDAVPDLIVQWGRRSDRVLEHRAYAGATGQVLWNAEPQQKGSTRFPAGGAVTDWNGDGVDDFVHQYYDTQVLSGVDGSVLAQTQRGTLVYFMTTIFDVDGDDASELVLHGGFSPARTMERDLVTPLWVGTEDDRPYPYGSIADSCPDGVPRLVEGSLVRSSTLKLTQLSGPAAGTYQFVVLAGGAAYASEDDARAAGAFLGQLTSTSLHRDLTGTGRPIAVVGSEDGWLYAVDGCTAELVFAVPFAAAVGAISFGDTDGDGLDEIIAAVGDGYLYALAQPPVAAPTTVVDLDPAADPANVDEGDVDVIEVRDRVAAKWEAVDGADSYQVAVVRELTGEIVSVPRWQDVGNATRATVTGLALAPGEQYVFAVRAMKGGEPSPDGMSDGVIIEAMPPDGPGPGPGPEPEPLPMPVGGCGCQSSPATALSDASTWLLLAAGLVLLWRRGRRRAA